MLFKSRIKKPIWAALIAALLTIAPASAKAYCPDRAIALQKCHPRWEGSRSSQNSADVRNYEFFGVNFHLRKPPAALELLSAFPFIYVSHEGGHMAEAYRQGASDFWWELDQGWRPVWFYDFNKRYTRRQASEIQAAGLIASQKWAQMAQGSRLGQAALVLSAVDKIHYAIWPGTILDKDGDVANLKRLNPGAPIEPILLVAAASELHQAFSPYPLPFDARFEFVTIHGVPAMQITGKF